ncbi:talin rod domain-containing protein 1-like [Carcharodon carcharias]|uniref:talin rod domain-containing protein 1-like n=1 Tax=Carcharodon carcharias TaxID=13397 RepID=UPI001B7F0A31|nr:talin rod domain-containing protein 1-like [Carcharodon carcharias]
MDCSHWEGALDAPGSDSESRLVYVSDSCKRKIQHVVDLLLSGDARPVDAKSLSACGESFEKCRDTIIARTKGLAILVHGLQYLVPVSKDEDVGQGLAELCNLVVALVECSSHAGYLAALETPGAKPARPGPVERYQVSVLEQEVEQHCSALRDLPLSQLSPPLLSDLSQGVSRALRALAECCGAAAESGRDAFACDQLKLGLRGAACCASALLACVKELRAAPSEAARTRCVVFSGPLIQSVRALVGLATEPQFLGRPAHLPTDARLVHASILEGARRVASSCLLFTQWVRDLALLAGSGAKVPAFREQLKSLAGAVSDSCNLLSQALRHNDTLNIFNPWTAEPPS